MPLKIQRDDQLSINLTPMIDIVFLLIIFFMVGTKFSELETAERDIVLQVPQVSNAESLHDPPKPQVINVYADGTIALSGESLSLTDLARRLRDGKATYQQSGVVIRGDGQVVYQQVADVIATCRQSEITNLNIAVRPIERR